MQQHNIRGLPKKFRGRCQPAVFQKISVQSLTPHTRPGDYSPPGDFATEKKVLDMRRLQSFLRRYQKQHHLASRFARELLEWDAILRDKSWGLSFHLWCQQQQQQQPELGPPGYPWPFCDYVFIVFELTKYHSEAEVKASQTKWQRRRQSPGPSCCTYLQGHFGCTPFLVA